MAKVGKGPAEYLGQSPKPGKACHRCVMFRPPEACVTVQGTIDPRGTCKYFEDKGYHPMDAEVPVPRSSS